MASKDNQRVRSHLQARIYLGGVNIGSGRTQSFDADHDFGTQPVHGVGDYTPVEHVFLKFNGTISMESFMLRTDDLVTLGVAALGAEILNLGVLDISLYDEKQNLLRTYQDCVIQRYRESIREGQICGENATVFFRTVDKQAPTNNPAAAQVAANPTPNPGTQPGDTPSA